MSEATKNGVANRLPKAPAKTQIVKLERIKLKTIRLKLIGTSSLLCHQLCDITDKTKLSDEELFKRSLYHAYGSTPAKPLYGLPASAFSRAIESSRRFYQGAGKKGKDFWSGAIKIKNADPNGIVPFTKCSVPEMKIDQGRNKMGQVVRTVRAMIVDWELELVIEFNEAILTAEIVTNQIEHAGFHVGVGAFRPEKGGTHGTFSVKVG